MTMATAECPHCGKSYTTNLLARHIGVCLSVPGRFEAVRKALDDGSGRIKMQQTYAHTHGSLPSENTLYALVGSGRWGDVAAHFNLTYSCKRTDRRLSPIVGRGYAAVAHEEEQVTVCGLPVCRIVDYGYTVGFVLR